MWHTIRCLLITGIGAAETEWWTCREAEVYLIKPSGNRALLRTVQRLTTLAPS